MKLLVQIGLIFVLMGFINCAETRELQFKHLSQNALLSCHHVNQITQLSQGFMLFSTTSGVPLFDGKQLIEFNIENLADISPLNLRVYADFQDLTENIWFATSLGM